MASKKKKGLKTVEKKCELATMMNVFNVTCRRLMVPSYKPLVLTVEKLLEINKPLDRVVFQDPEINPPYVQALTDALAGYSYVKTICFWGCQIGDQGLEQLACLLQASAGPKWRGSRIAWLEITNDGNQLQPSKWGQRYMDMVQGGTALGTKGQGFEMPNFQVDPLSSYSDAAAFAAAPVSEANSASVGWTYNPAITTIMSNVHLNPDICDTPCLNPSHPALQTCDPQAGQQQAVTFSAMALKRLATAIRTAGVGLTTIILDHCNIGDAGVAALSDGLMQCEKLVRLSLAYCKLTAAGAQSLANTMKPSLDKRIAASQPKYRTINLQGNLLLGSGLVHIAEAASLCTTLKSLNLSSIGVVSTDQYGLQCMASALQQNTSLEVLDISANQIGDSGAGLFLDVLDASKHVRQLRLTKHISRSMAQSISALLMERNVRSKKKSVGAAAAAAAVKPGPMSSKLSTNGTRRNSVVDVKAATAALEAAASRAVELQKLETQGKEGSKPPTIQE